MDNAQIINENNWQEVKGIFERAINLQVTEVDGYLLKVCHGNNELVEAIKRLVDTHHNEKGKTGYINDKVLNKNNKLIEADYHIGKYVIKEHLGSGGMGDVYSAIRLDDVYQKVAIKTLKNRFNQSGLQRFKIEKNILAHLEHPNIARLIDADEESGIAYYVMEYIDGMPIDEYCKKHQLTVNQRLMLFKQVCQVVNYAHINLVVHRDLKPNNILVTQAGEIKLIDFGVAKLLEALPGVPEVNQTTEGSLNLSLQYAAPEQLTQETVGTTCDVYALGLLLYELLTESVAQNLSNKNLAEIQHTINHVLPIIPSKVIHKKPPKPANYQLKTVKQLSQILKNDLDVVINHAIKKEPTQRYQSVSAFETDINRVIEHKPIKIKNDIFLYKAYKFLRRNRVWHLLGLVVLTTSAVIFSYIQKQNQQVLDQQIKTQDITNILIKSFKYADPTRSLAGDLKAVDVIDEAAKILKNDQHIESNNRDEIVLSLGEIYNNMAESQKALDLLNNNESRYVQFSDNNKALFLAEKAKAMSKLVGAKETLAFINEHATAGVKEILPFKLAHAYLMTENGGYLESEKILESVFDNIDSTNDDYYSICFQLARTKSVSYKNKEAREVLSECIESLSVVKDQNHSWEINQLKERLVILDLRDRKLSQAEQGIMEVMEFRKIVFGEHHISVADAYSTYSAILNELERIEEATQFTQMSLKIREQVFGLGHRNLAIPYFNFGVQAFGNEEYEQSEQYIAQAIQILEDFDMQDGSLGYFYYSLGQLYIEIEKWVKASDALKKALSLHQLIYDNDNLNIVIVNLHLGHVYLEQNKFTEAESLINTAYPILMDKLVEEHPSRAYAIEVFELLTQALEK